MKSLLASVAALTVLASVAHAQTPPNASPDGKGPPAPMGQGMRPPMGMDGGPDRGGPDHGGPDHGGPGGMGPHGRPPMGMSPGPMAFEGGPRGPHVHLHKGDVDLDLSCKPDESTTACTDQALRLLQASSAK